MKEFIKKVFRNLDGKTTNKVPTKKSKYLIVIGVTGLLLLIIGNVFSNSSPESNSNQTIGDPVVQQQETKPVSSEKKSTSNAHDLEASYEKELKDLLEKINGVSEVEIMVNLDSTKVKVYEKNLITSKQTTDESDKNGGTRVIEDYTKESQVVLVRQGDKEVPLLIQTKKPEVRGVFVIAKGVDHATVEKWVVEAVSKVLDVPTHRVSVMSKS
ncbi:stage III sporulation protein AG [Virgibacillus necropolis]|uniref:Stage III sporulation protein AG n=1 Tax=Virgibacillus necropolis TaxID=163877 RepID=A0A221MCB3_9BACI|nr:stage III sporulation protein AG [Virgibacillus necropolis]ASN05283.1 stage III sporulation protein AG [Virgibacillus necropolis]